MLRKLKHNLLLSCSKVWGKSLFHNSFSSKLFQNFRILGFYLHWYSRMGQINKTTNFDQYNNFFILFPEKIRGKRWTVLRIWGLRLLFRYTDLHGTFTGFWCFNGVVILHCGFLACVGTGRILTLPVRSYFSWCSCVLRNVLLKRSLRRSLRRHTSESVPAHDILKSTLYWLASQVFGQDKKLMIG